MLYKSLTRLLAAVWGLLYIENLTAVWLAAGGTVCGNGVLPGGAVWFCRSRASPVGVAVGTAVAGFLRFMCSFLSGVLVWGNLSDGLSAWTYSLVYNASYMLPETLITVVGAVLLIRVAPQIFDRQYAKA